MATYMILGGQNVTAPSASATTFAGLQRMNFGTTEATFTMRWPTTGVFRNMIVFTSAAPGAAASGKSLTFTLRQNGTTDTAMSAQLLETATTARYTATDISVTAGDRLTWKCVPANTPTVGVIVIVVEFEATTAGESGYGWTMETLSNTATRWNGVLQGQAFGSTSGPAIADIFAIDGAITAGYFDLSGVPGSAKSYTAVLYLSTDGGATYVKQDGTGGTPNTTITLTGTVAGAGVTEGSFSATVNITAGNLAYWEVTPASTPNLVNARCSVKFVATTDGEAMLAGSNGAAPSTSTTNYGVPSNVGASWSATSTANTIIGGVKTYTLDQLWVAIPAGNPGGVGKQYTYAYRLNNTDPAGGPSVVLSNTEITDTDSTGIVTVSDGNTLNMKSVPSGTPTARRPTWSARQKLSAAVGPTSRVRIFSFGWG